MSSVQWLSTRSVPNPPVSSKRCGNPLCKGVGHTFNNCQHVSIENQFVEIRNVASYSLANVYPLFLRAYIEKLTKIQLRMMGYTVKQIGTINGLKVARESIMKTFYHDKLNVNLNGGLSISDVRSQSLAILSPILMEELTVRMIGLGVPLRLTAYEQLVENERNAHLLLIQTRDQRQSETVEYSVLTNTISQARDRMTALRTSREVLNARYERNVNSVLISRDELEEYLRTHDKSGNLLKRTFNIIMTNDDGGDVEDEYEVDVENFEFEGNLYLRSVDNKLYDVTTNELKGKFNEVRQIIEEYDDSKEEKEECPICYDCIDDANSCDLNCGHKYCSVCITRYLDTLKKTQEPTCSLCRESITSIKCPNVTTKNDMVVKYCAVVVDDDVVVIV